MIGILYLVWGIFVIIYELIRKKEKIIDVITIINVVIGVNYILPAFVHVNKEFFDFTSEYTTRYGYDLEPTIEGFLSCFLFYSIFLFSYRIFYKRNNKYIYIIGNELNITILISTCTLIFSSILFFYYSSFFGGPISLITNANLIRGGVIKPNAQDSFMFINKLFQCAKFVPVLILPYYNKNKKLRILIIIYVIITFLITLSSGSRGELLLFIIIFILGGLIDKRITKIKIRTIVFLFAIFYFGIVLLRPLMDSLPILKSDGLSAAFNYYVSVIISDGKYSIQGLIGMINNLTHSFEPPYISLETAIQAIESNVHIKNYFYEWIIALLNIVPSKLLGIEKPIMLTVYNSAYISGAFNQVQIPSGIIAAIIYGFGLLGIPFYGLLLGLLAAKVEQFYRKIRDSIRCSSYLYVFLLILYYDIILGGDWATKIAINFTTLIFLIWFRLYFKRKKKVKGSV